MRKMRILEGFEVNVSKLNLLWMAYTYEMFSLLRESAMYSLKFFKEVGCSGVAWWRLGWSYGARQDNSACGGVILLGLAQTRSWQSCKEVPYMPDS